MVGDGDKATGSESAPEAQPKAASTAPGQPITEALPEAASATPKAQSKPEAGSEVQTSPPSDPDAKDQVSSTSTESKREEELQKEYGAVVKNLSEGHPLRKRYNKVVSQQESLQKVKRYEVSIDYRIDWDDYYRSKSAEIRGLKEDIDVNKSEESTRKLDKIKGDLEKKKDDLKKDLDIMRGRKVYAFSAPPQYPASKLSPVTTPSPATPRSADAKRAQANSSGVATPRGSASSAITAPGPATATGSATVPGSATPRSEDAKRAQANSRGADTPRNAAFSTDAKKEELQKEYGALTERLGVDHPLTVEYKRVLFSNGSLKDVKDYEKSSDYKTARENYLEDKRIEFNNLSFKINLHNDNPQSYEDEIKEQAIKSRNEIETALEIDKNMMSGMQEEPDIKEESKSSSKESRPDNVAVSIAKRAVSFVKSAYQLVKNTILSTTTSDNGKESPYATDVVVGTVVDPATKGKENDVVEGTVVGMPVGVEEQLQSKSSKEKETVPNKPEAHPPQKLSQAERTPESNFEFTPDNTPRVADNSRGKGK